MMRRESSTSTALSSAALLIAALLGASGCQSAPTHDAPSPLTREAVSLAPERTGANLPARSLVAAPVRPEMKPIAPGVLRGEMILKWDTGASSMLWLYLPDTGGRPMLDRSLPLVLIAPAGTEGLTGAAPSEADEAEHVPWVRAGFAVVAYEVDGALVASTDGVAPSAQDYLKSIRAFRDTAGGLLNAVEASDVAGKVLREADLDRVVLVGSGSGGTIALNVARAWHKLKWAKAVVVFSPILDVAGATDKMMLDALDSAQPGVARFARESSPGLVPEQLTVPAFLFTSREAGSTSIAAAPSDAAALERYAQSLRAAGRSPQVIVVPTGDPYIAMVREGIDLAIEWTQRELNRETR